jgi:outer membrane protein OmpA-like peptidoglycan-associated protein
MRAILVQVLLLFFIQVEAQTTSENQPNYLLRSVYFRGGSHYVDSLQRANLIHFIDSIPNIQQYQLSIHSHTDDIGGAAYNAWLSKMRSESVIDELLDLEINPNSIVIKDFGQFNPVYDNDTPLGRRLNRRVDIIFWPMVQ